MFFKECRRALELHDSALATEVCSLVGLSVLQTHTCYVFETDGAVRKIHKPISSWPKGKQAGFTVLFWGSLNISFAVSEQVRLPYLSICLPNCLSPHPVTLLTSFHHFGNKPFDVTGYKTFPLLFFLLNRWYKRTSACLTLTKLVHWCMRPLFTCSTWVRTLSLNCLASFEGLKWGETNKSKWTVKKIKVRCRTSRKRLCAHQKTDKTASKVS